MAEHPQEAPQQVPVEPGSAAGEPQPQQQQRHQEGSSIQGMAATPGDLDEEFYMYSFKVAPCTKPEPHEPEDCPFAHPAEKATRRDPRAFTYTGVSCPLYRKGCCKEGEACRYAHGVFEVWLHPSRFRTELCKDGADCTRKCCFFAHSLDQLRQATPGLVLPPKTAVSSSAAASSASPVTASSTSSSDSSSRATDGASSDSSEGSAAPGGSSRRQGRPSAFAAAATRGHPLRSASAPAGGLGPAAVGQVANKLPPAAPLANRASSGRLPLPPQHPAAAAPPGFVRLHNSSSAGQLAGMASAPRLIGQSQHASAPHQLSHSWGGNSLAAAGGTRIPSPLSLPPQHHAGSHSPLTHHVGSGVAALMPRASSCALPGAAPLASAALLMQHPPASLVPGLSSAPGAVGAAAAGAGGHMMQVPAHIALEAALVASAARPPASLAVCDPVMMAAAAAAAAAAGDLSSWGSAAAAGVHPASLSGMLAGSPPLTGQAAPSSLALAAAAASAHEALSLQHQELVSALLLQQTLSAAEQQQHQLADGEQQHLQAMWAAAFGAARNVGLSDADAAACADCAVQQEHSAAAKAAALACVHPGAGSSLMPHAAAVSMPAPALAAGVASKLHEQPAALPALVLAHQQLLLHPQPASLEALTSLQQQQLLMTGDLAAAHCLAGLQSGALCGLSGALGLLSGLGA